MAVIGGFRSDLSITRKTDGNFGNVSAGVLFFKVRINENGGKTVNSACMEQVFQGKTFYFTTYAVISIQEYKIIPGSFSMSGMPGC